MCATNIGCKNLTHIAFLGAPATTVGSQAFDDGTAAGYSNIKSRATIYVREKEESNFKAATFWKDFANISTSFEVGTEEYLPMSPGYVNMLNSKADVNTYVVPSLVSDGSINYIVGLIGDYAFEENTSTKLKELVTFDNVEYIGAKAFKQAGEQTINSIFFIQKEPTKQLLSTTRFELTPEDLPVVDGHKDDQYKEFADDMKIYVRKSSYNKVMQDWSAYSDMIDYKIKDAQITNKYGTFSREFDVDFSECSDQQVLAFTGNLTGVIPGSGDYGESQYNIRMESINCGTAGDGTYVPQNTGVLLKYMTDVATTDAYYTIGENTTNDSYQPTSKYTGANVMKGVTVDGQVVDATTGKSIYVMQKGLFRYVNPSTTPSLTMPVHKAYLELTDVPGGAKINLVFDDGSADSINMIDNEILPADAAIYNLAGQRVSASQRGVLIVNGKKIVR